MSGAIFRFVDQPISATGSQTLLGKNQLVVKEYRHTIDLNDPNTYTLSLTATMLGKDGKAIAFDKDSLMVEDPKTRLYALPMLAPLHRLASVPL